MVNGLWIRGWGMVNGLLRMGGLVRYKEWEVEIVFHCCNGFCLNLRDDIHFCEHPC